MPISRNNAILAIVLAAGACIMASWAWFERQTGPQTPKLQFVVASNSMAPRIWGPHFRAACEACSRDYELAAESTNRQRPCTCPFCGGNCVISEQRLPGQKVSIEPIADASPLSRFDIVAIDVAVGPVQPTNGPILKRLWGLPSEEIEIGGGEFWIGGQLLRKPISAIRELAVEIESVTFAELFRPSVPVKHSRFKASRTVGQLQIQWRPEGQSAIQKDKLLSDDTLLNQGASYVPLRTEDILLQLQFTSDSRPRNLVASWTYGDAVVAVELKSVSDEAADREVVSPSTLSHLLLSHPLTAVESIELAWCDGCLTVVQDGKISLDRQRVSGGSTSLDIQQMASSSERLPRTLTLKFDVDASTEVGIGEGQASENAPGGWRLVLSRDIILRSLGRQPERSEERIALEEDEFFVLGDNQPISTDSRFAGPVRAEQIIGRLQ